MFDTEISASVLSEGSRMRKAMRRGDIKVSKGGNTDFGGDHGDKGMVIAKTARGRQQMFGKSGKPKMGMKKGHQGRRAERELATNMPAHVSKGKIHTRHAQPTADTSQGMWDREAGDVKKYRERMKKHKASRGKKTKMVFGVERVVKEDAPISASILSEGSRGEKRLRRRNPDDKKAVYARQARHYSRRRGEGDTTDSRGKNRPGVSDTAAGGYDDSAQVKWDARKTAHKTQRGQSPKGHTRGDQKVIFGKRHIFNGGKWVMKEDHEVSASILREGSMSFRNIQAKFKGKGKGAPKTYGPEWQGIRARREHHQDTAIEREGENPQTRKKRLAAHKVRRGKKTK